MTTATAIKIKKVELKSIKVHMNMSEGTICYSANIYINGKKAGDIRNSGTGGCSLMYCEHDKALREWSKQQPNELFLTKESYEKYGFGESHKKREGLDEVPTYEEYMKTWNKSPEDLFDHIAYETYETKSMNRKGKKSIHFKKQDTPHNSWIFYKGLEYNEENLAWLKNKHGDDIKEIYNPNKELDFGLVY